MKLRRINRKHATPVHETVLFCMLLAVTGGFLDAYTFVGRGGVFCNAQTGNIVLLGIYAAEGKWLSALSSLPPILSFVVGTFIAEAIKRKENYSHYLGWIDIILIVEMVVFFIIGFIPPTIPNVFITATVSLVASIQVSAFRKLVDAPFCTTMTTGNLRSATQAAYLAITKKEREAAIRSTRYFIIIFSFLFGGFIGGVITLLWGVKSIWAAILLLLCAFLLMNIWNYKAEKRAEQKSAAAA